ncbi:hypothetical protein ANCCAN_27878 [Ancylostoma caninum]|uniref:Uncharacterized protein n=1 Tax=Ancylostoma caninum TaxID=29170 RepID=A0A368F2S7_ANCCA|nr:hypothetical protein ANCCAN_27878 [Ancylostoma caninum]
MLYMCVTSISIGFHINGASTARQSSAQLCKTMEEKPEIERDYGFAGDNPQERLPDPKYRRQSMKFMGKGSIQFKDIHFSYPSRPDVKRPVRLLRWLRTLKGNGMIQFFEK